MKGNVYCKKAKVMLMGVLTAVFLVGCAKEEVELTPLENTESLSDIPLSDEDTGISEEAMPEQENIFDNSEVFNSFLNDELKFEDQTFSERYEEVIEQFEKPAVFYYDVDEDGVEELLVSTFYYGYDIFDAKEQELVLLAYGDGTADVCGVYEGEGHVYIGHSDFTHSGRQVLSLTRIDAAGNELESIKIMAEYPDSENDWYDENSEFTLNDQKITMQEYEEYMEKYKFVELTEAE